MVESRNVTVFWLCATLALSITLGAIGVTIVYEAIAAGDTPGRLSLRPGVGLLAIALSIGFAAIVLRRRWLATVLAVIVLICALIFSALKALPDENIIRILAINPVLLLVTTLIALSILTTVWTHQTSALGIVTAGVCLIAGALSLLSNWYPVLENFHLGSVAESNIVVSPLVMLVGATLPFMSSVFHRQIDVAYRGLLVIGASGILLTTAGWHALRLQHSHNLLERANTLATQLEASSVSNYAINLALIRRLAERWEYLGGLPPKAFREHEFTSYLRDFPEIRLLTVLDTKQRPVMTESRGLQYRLWINDFLRQPGTSEWLNHVHESRQPHLSRPRKTESERPHSVIAAPITLLQDLNWTIIAVVDLEHVYQALTQHIEEGLILRVTADGLTLFNQNPDLPPKQRIDLVSRTVETHHDTRWTVHISMAAGTLSPDDLYLPPLVLFSGIGLSFLVMLSYLFWRESERRSESLEMLNNTLNYHLDQERSLRFTNERILQFSRDILCSISVDGRFLSVSPACQEILGYSPDELQGKHYDLLLVQEDRAATEQEVQLLIFGDRDRASGFRTRLRHRDGHIITISWTSEWSKADKALFCVGRDITDELMAETLTRERDQFFSLSPDMFCIVDLNSYFFEMNQTFLETLGYSREELLGTSYLKLVNAEDKVSVRQAVQSLTEGHEVSELHIRVQDKQGNTHWLNINATLSADDLIYVVARDTTEQRRIEQKLRENEALLKMAERVAMIGGWVVDLNTGKSTWSDAVCAIHELPPGQAPDVEDAIQFYVPEHRERITNAVQTCIEDGIPFDEELQIITATGRQRWVRAIGHAVKDGNGDIAKLQGAFQDITASRQAMEQIRRFAERQATIFESITDAFFTVDREWRFTYVNRRSEELLRKSRDELLGHNLWEIFPAAAGTEFDENYRYAMDTRESVSFEGYYPPLYTWFEVSAYPSDEGLAVYYRSINERKEAQQKLEATMAELERSNRELQDFAFVASHDLQEPLRKIQAFSDRLINRSDKLDEQEKDYLRRMQSAAGRMQNLIEDLLSYSRVTTRAKDMVSCDTQSILKEVLQDMETSITQEQARITTEALPSTFGDATQLRQVLQNLLSNAIKFHTPERAPDISVAAEEVTDTAWTLVVSDNGIGFDERYAEKLFHPFQRLHQREGYKGTGIGMAIVKKILDRHGAKVTVNSIPGEGTTFRIRFRRIG